jgi:hypothetical protein
MKNVLITVGCSFTEGVGCYDYSSLNNKNPHDLSVKEHEKYYGTQLDNFLMGSWGTHLQKMLRYDLHINCGIGGSSNSHQIKNFMDTMASWPDLSKSNVLVIWQMTYPHRFSFYKNSSPQTFGFNNQDKFSHNHSNFIKEFIMNMSNTDFDRDMAFESLFYLRCMRDICKVNGYNFLFSTVGEPTFEGIIKNYLDKNTLENFIKIYDEKEDEFVSPLAYGFARGKAHCGHPISDGYKDMAEQYRKWIRNHRNELLYNGDNPKFEQIPMNREYHIIKEKRRIL